MIDSQQIIAEMELVAVQVSLNGNYFYLSGRELFALVAAAQLISRDSENGEIARTAIAGARKFHNLLEPDSLLAQELDTGWKLYNC